ncbi:MAG: hypothetical protein L6R41_003073 [Letrouitia leprolyta]|nr:MAG: hypothetical protein L6R41_003073 [Letrouitia leprolyta]
MPFKFSFPLPGRKASDDTYGSPILVDTPNGSHDDSPFSDPGSKAERVLGTLEPASPHGLSNKSSGKALRKKHSFMSSTLSEGDNNSTGAKDGFPFPDMPNSRGSSRRPSHNLQNQASSPLLGERFFKGSPGTDSTTNSPSPRPHFYGSSSTLRSYYDPAKSPLSISQQTSASSARDMALRKGYPIISSPLTQDVSNEISPSAVDDEQRPATDHGPTRKPAHLDLSKFSTTHKTATPPTILSDEISKSPSQSSYSSSQQSASSGRPNWWKRKRAKEAKSKKAKELSEESYLDQHDLGVDSLKTNIRKPPAGMRHWFDGADHQRNLNALMGQSDPDETQGQFWNRRLDALQPDARECSENVDQRDTTELSRHRSPLLDNPKVSEPVIMQQEFSSEGTSNPQSQPKTRSRSSTAAKADLLNYSFLELSSSDDEEAESSIHQSQAYQCHRIRDSIDQNSIGKDVLVSNAEVIRPVKPKPVMNTSPRKSKRGSEIIPPVPKIPERPQLQQRVSSMKWRELQNLNSSSITARTTDDSHSSSGGGSIASQASSLRQTVFESHMRKPNPSSKLMSVTTEEGELLEAMRQTRASIRQDAFPGSGYTRTLPSPRSNVGRPRTSGAAGRASYMGSDRSISPPPSLPATNASPQSFRFPEVPSSENNDNNDSKSISPAAPSSSRRAKPKRAPLIIFPPPKASPTESFSPSDILPSTPRSRLSPLTPSSSTVLDDGEGFDGRGTMRMGHVRKRTVSSGVVVLDGMEERARIWESEEEWGGVLGTGERW